MKRPHVHIDRVESELASSPCPECGCRWKSRRGAARPGAVTVVCTRGHVFVAFLYRGQLNLQSAGDDVVGRSERRKEGAERGNASGRDPGTGTNTLAAARSGRRNPDRERT